MSRPIGSVLVLLAALGALVAVIGTGCGGAAGGPTDGDTIAPPDELGAGTITGSVVDASDTSVAVGNAYVHVPRASVASAYSPAYLRAVNYAHGYSAEDGSYQLESLPAGRLTMIVDPPADSGYSGLTIELDMPEGATINIRVTLAKSELAEQVSAVTVDPPNATVLPGATQQYTATVVGAGGATLDLAPVWVTTGGAGSIDENGLFTAGSEEKSGTIVAVVGAYSGSTTVSVATPDNPPPTVSLDVAPPSGQAPLTVAAAATASDSNGSVASVSLDWGDGSGAYTGSSFPTNLPHTYSTVGDYTVTATATDDQGAQGSATAVVHVTDHPIVAPTCSLSATPSSGEAPLDVAFTGAGSDADGTISSWTLNFGDGSALWTGSAAPSGLSHAYSSAGTYTAMLTVVDNDGASASATQTISVSTTDCKPPTAALTATPTSGTAPLTVSFNGSGTDPNSGGSIVEYRLDFQGDGTDDWARTSPPTNVTYVYSAAGAYAPKLTVVNACGAPGSAIQTVQVTPPPALSVSPTSLDFGLTETSKTFSIANAGGGTLTWSASESTSWITNVAPSSGSGAGTVTVTVDRTGLSAGTYSGSISISSNGGAATVTVSIQANPPTLAVTPTSLSFGYALTSLSFGVANSGGGSLDWSVTESLGWVTSASPASGTDSGTVTVSVDRSSLSTGTHSGVISVSSNGGNAQVSVSIRAGGKLAFVTTGGDGSPTGVFTMNLDGTGLTRITTPATGEYDSLPRWSPDGSKIAFWRDITAPTPNRIFVVPSGGNESQISQRATDVEWSSGPTWSPNGATLLFCTTYWAPNTPVLATANSDGSGTTTRLQEPAADLGRSSPDYSPSGGGIVYALGSVSGGTTSYAIALLSGASLATAPAGHYYDYPKWSPDGTKIAFHGGVYGGNYDIMVMNADGSGLANLTSSSSADERSCTWAPDGSALIFVSNRDGDRELYMMDATGGNVTQLTNNTWDDSEPDWL